jgi:hypothetical protein
MHRFSFGPRDNEIAYTVADIQDGMRRPLRPPEGVYRGATTSMQVSLGITFFGEVMVELIEQHNEEPSIFRETLRARGAMGFTIGRSAPGTSKRHRRNAGRVDTTRRSPTLLQWVSASSISIPRTACPACLRSSK